jgi:predicted nucleotidyltransferase
MLNSEQIGQISQRIQERIHPQKIILFGSYAEGKATEDSDVDLMVVADTDLPYVDRYGMVRRVLNDFPASFDIVVKTPLEYRQQKDVKNNIVYFADKYGTVLYER